MFIVVSQEPSTCSLLSWMNPVLAVPHHITSRSILILSPNLTTPSKCLIALFFFLPEPSLNFLLPFCSSHSLCSFSRLVSRKQVSHPAQDCLSCYTQFMHDFTVPNFKYIVLVTDILDIVYILKMQSVSVDKLLILAHSLRRVTKCAY